MQKDQGTSIVNNRDIVILCSPRLAEEISQAFVRQLSEWKIPASVIWSGISAKYRQGIVVLEWEGEVPPDFVQQLDIDTDVIDYAIYEVPTIEGEYIDTRATSSQNGSHSASMFECKHHVNSFLTEATELR